MFLSFSAHPVPSRQTKSDLHGSMKRCGMGQLRFSAPHTVHKEFSFHLDWDTISLFWVIYILLNQNFFFRWIGRSPTQDLLEVTEALLKTKKWPSYLTDKTLHFAAKLTLLVNPKKTQIIPYPIYETFLSVIVLIWWPFLLYLGKYKPRSWPEL